MKLGQQEVKVWIKGSESMDKMKCKYGQQDVKVWTTGCENMDNRK